MYIKYITYLVLLTRHDNYTEAYYYRKMIKFDLRGRERAQKTQGGTAPPLPGIIIQKHTGSQFFWVGEGVL